MTGTVSLAAEVGQAVEELRSTFGHTSVAVTPDSDGGAWVVIDDVELGAAWTQQRSWLAFHIAATYPYADVYPHFIDAGCELAAGGLPEAITPGASFPEYQGTCLQISRKSNRWNPLTDTAATKALKVIEWVRSR